MFYVVRLHDQWGLIKLDCSAPTLRTPLRVKWFSHDGPGCLKSDKYLQKTNKNLTHPLSALVSKHTQVNSLNLCKTKFVSLPRTTDTRSSLPSFFIEINFYVLYIYRSQPNQWTLNSCWYCWTKHMSQHQYQYSIHPLLPFFLSSIQQPTDGSADYEVQGWFIYTFY